MTLTQAFALLVILVALNAAWNSYARNKNSSVESTTHPRAGSVIDSSTTKQETGGKESPHPLLVLIILFPLIMGLWAINYWVREYNIAVDSTKWKVVSGEIISKNIPLTANSGRSKSNSIQQTYVPSIEYAFLYRGKKYKGNNIDFSNRPAYADITKSQAVLDSFPDVGEKIDVYVSPDANNTCLKPGSKHSNPFGLIIGGILLLAGVAGMKKIFGF